MGNSNSNYLEDWKIVSIQKNYDIIQNSQTNQFAQLYHIPLNNNIPLYQNIQRYQYRKQDHHNCVQSNMCGTLQFMNVVTERIPIRLLDLKNLTDKEGFFILLQAFKGYQKIMVFNQTFFVNDKMIGINQKNEVKIWLNQNFGMNYANQFQSNITNSKLKQQKVQSAKFESNLVNGIYFTIQSHLKDKKFPQKFEIPFKKAKFKNLNEAILFTQQYLASQKIILSKTFNMNNPEEKSERIIKPPLELIPQKIQHQAEDKTKQKTPIMIKPNQQLNEVNIKYLPKQIHRISQIPNYIKPIQNKKLVSSYITKIKFQFNGIPSKSKQQEKQVLGSLEMKIATSINDGKQIPYNKQQYAAKLLEQLKFTQTVSIDPPKKFNNINNKIQQNIIWNYQSNSNNNLKLKSNNMISK